MKQEAVSLYEAFIAAHADLYLPLKRLRERMQRTNDMHELVDTVLVLREMYKYADDLRKEIQRTRDVCERITCVIWAKGTDAEPIRTAYVTASPDIKYMASIPKRKTDPEKYAALMNFLGIPDQLWRTTGPEVVRAHWPGFVDYVSARMEAGLPLPDGLDVEKTYPVYKLTLRRKKKEIIDTLPYTEGFGHLYAHAKVTAAVHSVTCYSG